MDQRLDPGTLWSCGAVLVATPASASIARDFVRRHLLEHGLPFLVDDVRLVVSELATNALRHAQTPFTVGLQGFAHSVVLTVHDWSPRRLVLTEPSPLEMSGRGLSIVARLSRDWGVCSDESGEGKSVWASFDRP